LEFLACQIGPLKYSIVVFQFAHEEFGHAPYAAMCFENTGDFERGIDRCSYEAFGFSVQRLDGNLDGDHSIGCPADLRVSTGVIGHIEDTFIGTREKPAATGHTISRSLTMYH
jgi:hypothetical protein